MDRFYCQLVRVEYISNSDRMEAEYFFFIYNRQEWFSPNHFKSDTNQQLYLSKCFKKLSLQS